MREKGAEEGREGEKGRKEERERWVRVLEAQV